MKIYIAICEDRHVDVTVHPFLDKERAIAWAKKEAHEDNKVDGDVDQPLTKEMIRDGWLYLGCYSCEGDCIRVVEVEMNEERSES